MTKSLAHPLQALVARAAATTPAQTGEVAAIRARHNAGGAHVILLDVSSSMAEPAGGGRTRIQHLRAALDQVARPDHRLLAFASAVTPMRTAADLPPPSGGTCLELGLDAAARHNPAATLVVCDGEPNNPEAALEVAARMPGRIDVLFVGDEGNAAAIDFMRRLARVGAGRSVVHRWGEQTRGTRAPLALTIGRLLLAGPAR